MAPGALPTSPFVKRGARSARGSSASSVRKSLLMLACLGGVVLLLAAMQLLAFRRMSAGSTSLSSPSLSALSDRNIGVPVGGGKLFSLIHHDGTDDVDSQRQRQLQQQQQEENMPAEDKLHERQRARRREDGGIRWTSRETAHQPVAHVVSETPRPDENSTSNHQNVSAQRNSSAIPFADRWPAAELYYPVTVTVRKTFQVHEYKQQQKLNSQLPGNVPWTDAIREVCERKTPECLFFELTKTPFLLKKCCVEHLKLRRTLFDVADLAEQAGLQIFLMFGTLLSSMRDGGWSLLPWETDIDLGILGAEPEVFQHGMDAARALLESSGAKRFQTKKPKNEGGVSSHNDGDDDHTLAFLRDDFVPHHVVPCRTDGNNRDAKRQGTCSDVHSVYYAADAAGSAIDTTRVEIWPYRRMLTARASLGMHNARQVGPKHIALLDLLKVYLQGGGSGNNGEVETKSDELLVWETVRRSELLLPERLVTPLAESVHADEGAAPKPCRLWGRQFLCPADSLRFLDVEYHGRDGWMKPKTIHWGSANVAAWK